MDEKMKKEFLQRMQTICSDFGIDNASITGNMGYEYIGILYIGPTQTPGDLFIAITNIGRLWQHGRNTVRDMLNAFEK